MVCFLSLVKKKTNKQKKEDVPHKVIDNLKEPRRYSMNGISAVFFHQYILISIFEICHKYENK